MAQTNEKLIRHVFEEMVKHKPSLQKYIIVDDDDDDEIDFRLLGDLLIKNFPWPIGVELRRLFSGSMRQLDRMRLDQIFKTIERTMQFVSFTMLAQLWNEANKGKITISETFASEFSNRFLVLSLGNFSWFIRAASKIADESKLEWFMPQMNNALDKNFLNSLDFWVPERNEIGHYQINLTQEEIEKRCVEYEEKLTYILTKISFLAKYNLVSVKEIKVEKQINKDASFLHVVDLLNNSDSDFKAKEIGESNFTESKSVLLMKSVKSIDEYLNLSPFVIDTNSEIIDNKEKFDIKKDIFLYTKYKSGHIMYTGTEVTEKCDLRSMSNYNRLVNEFKEMFQIIGKKEL